MLTGQFCEQEQQMQLNHMREELKRKVKNLEKCSAAINVRGD